MVFPGQTHLIILNLGRLFRRKCKYSSYLKLWQLSCSAEQNHLANFGRGHYEEHFGGIILNSDNWFRRRCCLKYILSRAPVVIMLPV